MKAVLLNAALAALATVCFGTSSALAAEEAPTVSTPPAAPDIQRTLENIVAGEAKTTEQQPIEAAAPQAVTLAAPDIEGEVIMHWPLQDAPIRLVLRQLAMSSRRNIVASPQVKGTISADLFDVTVDEALDALLTVNGFDYEEKGGFIYVYTTAELKKIREEARQTLTRMFHLYYIKAKDASALIAPCLSTDGRIATTPDVSEGIAASKESAGGMEFATNEVLVVSDYEENLQQIETVLEQADRQPDQILIETTIMVARLDENNKLGVNFSALDGVSLAGNPFELAFGAGAVAPFTAGDGLVFKWDGQDVDTLITALEGVTDVSILANPKLLVLNKQRGEIIVGRERGYLGRYTFNDDGSLGTQEVETMETGTRMRVRPFLGDNGVIRLEIHPEDSSGTLSEQNLPDKTTSECTTNIMVKDGHTIIISGMFRESTSTTRKQVPLFGNIPLIGAAFRETTDSVTREELIILITPRVMRQAEDQVASEKLRAEADRFRMSLRDNLQWFGRTRMAARYCNWARELAASGHTKLAWLNTRLALYNDPFMNEALELREKLIGRTLVSCEPEISSVRHVIREMMLNELQTLEKKDQDAGGEGEMDSTMPEKVGILDRPDKGGSLKLAPPALTAMIPGPATPGGELSADAGPAEMPAESEPVAAGPPSATPTEEVNSAVADAEAPAVDAPVADGAVPVAVPTPALAVNPALPVDVTEQAVATGEDAPVADGEPVAEQPETLAEAGENPPVETPGSDSVTEMGVAGSDVSSPEPVRPIMDMPEDIASAEQQADDQTEVEAAEAEQPVVDSHPHRSAFYMQPETGVRPLFVVPK